MSKASRVYAVAFGVVALVIAMLPVIFYFSKAVTNPAEFSPQKTSFMTVTIAAQNLLPEIVGRMKAGQVQRDRNGEENARIISFTEASVPGGRVDITLAVRYDDVLGERYLHPNGGLLKPGTKLTLDFKDYRIEDVVIAAIGEAS